MKRYLGPACAAAVLLCGFTQAQATIMTNSEFTASDEGWTASGGNLAHVGAGGNPGGYLQATDSANTVMKLFAPAPFLGDKSLYDGGVIGFDAQLFKSTGSPQPIFGTIEITDGITTASLDLAPGPASLGSWTVYSAALDAATWGLGNAAWTSLLSNVTSITLILEATFGQGEIVGLDNFHITNENVDEPVIPEPSSILLLALGTSGVAGIGFLRRKRHAAA